MSTEFSTLNAVVESKFTELLELKNRVEQLKAECEDARVMATQYMEQRNQAQKDADHWKKCFEMAQQSAALMKDHAAMLREQRDEAFYQTKKAEQQINRLEILLDAAQRGSDSE